MKRSSMKQGCWLLALATAGLGACVDPQAQTGEGEGAPAPEIKEDTQAVTNCVAHKNGELNVRILQDHTLKAGQAVTSCNGKYKLVMQNDGNFVFYYQGGTNRALWATNTVGTGANRAVMQKDGNLVLYDAANVPRWASHTAGNPYAYLTVTNNGELIIRRDVDGHPLRRLYTMWLSPQIFSYTSNSRLVHHGGFNVMQGFGPQAWPGANAFSVQFWGRPVGCNHVFNGTAAQFQWGGLDVLAETGIPDGVEKYTPDCPGVGQGRSYYRLGAGIGLFTGYYYPWNFFGNFDAGGQWWLPGGPNRYILATYVDFWKHVDTEKHWADPLITYPFTGNSADNNLRRMAIVSYQGSPQTDIRNNRTQIQQNMQVELVNKQCGRREGNRKCALNIVIPTRVEGLNQDAGKDMYYLNDGGSGGLPTLIGQLRGPGHPTIFKYCWSWMGDCVAMRSWAAATTHWAFTSGVRFQAEISVNQFFRMLKYVTAQVLQLVQREPTHAQVTSVFGEGWDNVWNWGMAHARFGQEVYNEQFATSGANIGGNITELSVIALPYY